MPEKFTTPSGWDLIVGILTIFAVIAVVTWIMVRWFRRSRDPGKLIIQWFITAAAVSVILFFFFPMAAAGGVGGAFIGVPGCAVIAILIAFTWREDIGLFFARPLSSLYDGGDDEDDPKPYYSSALKKRSRGDYDGARLEVHEQLQRFPTDVQGQMLLAEMEAQDFKDLRSAETVIERFINQRNHAPANIAYALNSMADWHLKYGQDRDAARACIEQIIERIPDSEWALRAAQRVAHLGSTEMLLGPDSRRIFKVAHIEGDPGLDQRQGAYSPLEEHPEEAAAKHVKHLEEFPHDSEAREKLAQIYARHFHRLDLAQDQLEQLIQYPNQPWKQVVRWVNLLADFQVEHAMPYDTVRATLQRIIDLYPDAATASMTQNRIERLRLEFKGKEKSQAVALGSYEDDLGLKGGSAH